MQKLLLLITLISLPTFAKETLCPSMGIASKEGDKPVISLKTNGFQVFICGSIDVEKGKDIYSGFNVYSKKNGKTSELMTSSELDSFSIIKNRKNSLHFVKMIYFREKMIPAVIKKLKCDSHSCAFSVEKCVFKNPKTFKTDILVKIAAYTKKGSKKDESPDEALIDELEALALTGNKKAIQYFENSHELKLDGASAENYNSAKELISLLKKSGCSL